MKKVLFLGGAITQLSAIQYAKEKGYFIVLCDYIKNNPGRAFCDRYYCVSTTNKEEVLAIAEKENIDGIVAYVSEAAVATAAYVGNKLNLPSHAYETAVLLSNKNLFRAFLKRHGFNHPYSETFHTITDARNAISSFTFPVMVKPVDSSGSRGIRRIDDVSELNAAFQYAMSESKQKLVIIEQYIEMAEDFILGGDVIVVDGEIQFFGKINGHRDVQNKCYIPYGNSYPSILDHEKLSRIRGEIQRTIDLLAIKTAVLNVDIVFDKLDEPYIIEMAARNGGNMISELLEVATGINLAEITVEMALGHQLDIKTLEPENYYSTYYVHTNERGKLQQVFIKDEIKENIIGQVMYKKCGEEVDAFDGLNKVIGILILKYSSKEELTYKMKNMNRYIDVQMIESVS